MFRISFAVLLIFGFAPLIYAQDSIKKPAPGTPATAASKSYSKYKTHRYHSYGDSGAIKRQIQDSLHFRTTGNQAAAGVDNSIKGQYQYLLNRVYDFQGPLISAFGKNVLDTLNAVRTKLKAAEDKVSKAVDTVNTTPTDDSQRTPGTTIASNEIDVFGIVISKSLYNLIVWGLVALLAIITFTVVGRSGSHRREAKYRSQLYGELEDEFKVYKKQANEKEKKLARELQTERNKLDELLGRG
jgi:hypothetical protein